MSIYFWYIELLSHIGPANSHANEQKSKDQYAPEQQFKEKSATKPQAKEQHVTEKLANEQKSQRATSQRAKINQQ
jgi:hypothetical protein